MEKVKVVKVTKYLDSNNVEFNTELKAQMSTAWFTLKTIIEDCYDFEDLKEDSILKSHLISEQESFNEALNFIKEHSTWSSF